MKISEKKLSRRKYVAVAGAAVAAAAIGGAAYYLSQPGPPAPTPSPTPTPTPTATPTPTPTPTPTIPIIGKFTVMREKGYTESEDKSWHEVLQAFSDKYGIEYDLILPSTEDLSIKLQSAVELGNPPDISYGSHSQIARYAFEGRLLDITDVMEPLKSNITPIAIEGGMLYDNTVEKRYWNNGCWACGGYFLHVNKALIRKAGEDPENIPKDWDEFHNFFKKIQDELGGPPPYAFGYPQTTASRGDGPNMVEQLFTTMGGEMVSKDGKELIIDQEENKGILIKTIEILTNLIKEGYCPKEALTWKAPENNVAFNTGLTVIMWNGTLSVPMWWLNNNPDGYYNDIATIDAPKGPNGEEWTYGMAGIGLQSYKEAKNKELAKKFIGYMMEPETQIKILQTMKGRYFPSRKEAAEDPRMKEGFVTADHPVDPNYPAQYRQLFERKNFILWEFVNPALGDMVVGGCLTDPCARVIVDGLTPKEAVEEQIPRMQEFWDTYYKA